MFERFTDQARRTVVGAQDEARLRAHNYIGTEHLLLGLVRDPTNVATRALERVGVTPDQVRTRIDAAVPRGTREPGGHIPFTPRAKRSLEAALREAHRFRHDHIGTEHLVLGLLVEEDGVAAHTLRDAGVDLDQLRAAVADVLAASPQQTQRIAPHTVYVAYRRGHGPWVAGRVADELVRQLGARRVQLDAGPVDEVLPQCDTVLVLVDRDWTEPPEPEVAAELALADRLHKQIIPVLIEDAAAPTASWVPADVEPARVGHAEFRVGMHDLVRRVRGEAA
jgi:ATP-dependent Clp protease ATP-binding subunit ClpC